MLPLSFLIVRPVGVPLSNPPCESVIVGEPLLAVKFASATIRFAPVLSKPAATTLPPVLPADADAM